jgi:hypothetical protein
MAGSVVDDARRAFRSSVVDCKENWDTRRDKQAIRSDVYGLEFRRGGPDGLPYYRAAVAAVTGIGELNDT